MAKRVSQIRWYGDNHADNYPTNISMEMLRYGTAFPRTYPISRIAIQSIPGTKVYINSGVNPVVIGSTGIYELDVDGISNISSVCFDNASLQVIYKAKQSVIIDYIYETE